MRKRNPRTKQSLEPTLEELSNHFLHWVDNSYSLEKATRRYYRYGWKLLSGTPIASLGVSRITKSFCDTLHFPGGPAAANTALRTLRRMLAYAVEGGIAPSACNVSLRKEWPRSVSMSMAQAKLIADHMPAGDPKDAFLILRATGMRPRECFSMRWEFVNWDSQIYQNPKGKRASARRAVPLLYDSLHILRARQVSQGGLMSGWVFPAVSGSGHLETIQKAFTAARDKAGLPREMVLYTARHGAATDLAQIVSLKESMAIMGHTDVATALRYQHPSTASIQAKLTERLQ